MTRVLAWVVGIVVAVLIAVGSVAPWRSHPSPDGLIRLAWSARPQRIEHCRRLSDEELAGVPAHMQERVHCEGRAARYRMTALIDGVARVHDTVRGGGARHEGLIHLLKDLRVVPGTHRLEIEIVQLDSATALTDSLGTPSSERERRMEATRERVRREALPQRVRLDSVITLSDREITLIGYDPEGQRLTVVRRGTVTP